MRLKIENNYLELENLNPNASKMKANFEKRIVWEENTF